MIISHLFKNEETGEWHLQSNQEHQHGVALLAERFGSDLGCASMCRVMGELHDLGKEQADFQKYIRRNSGYDTSINYTGHPEHAYVGALTVNQLMPSFGGYFMGMILSAHHSGLKDYTDYRSLLQRSLPAEIHLPSAESVEVSPDQFPRFDTEEFHHFTRMLFSCLVDADFLDTEAFMLGRPRAVLFQNQNTPTELLAKLEQHLGFVLFAALSQDMVDYNTE